MAADRDGELDGKYASWYDNGQLEIETNFKFGKHDGKYNSWYENGKKRSEFYYINDKLNGSWKVWHEDKWGLKFKAKYKDGICISGDC